jgi:hypothetical protein
VSSASSFIFGYSSVVVPDNDLSGTDDKIASVVDHFEILFLDLFYPVDPLVYPSDYISQLLVDIERHGSI